MPDYDKYDPINTLAARWLVWNSKEKKKPLGIKQFKCKKLTHMWLLNIMNSFSIASGYEDFYLDCSFWTYLYIKYIKKFKHIKRFKNEDVFLIEPELFAVEVCEQFGERPNKVEYIYEDYWG